MNRPVGHAKLIRWAVAILLLLTLPIDPAKPVYVDTDACAACNLHHARLTHHARQSSDHVQTILGVGSFQ
jgi:hypothetical protein